MSATFASDRHQFLRLIRELVSWAELKAMAGSQEFPQEARTRADKGIERCKQKLLELAGLEKPIGAGRTHLQ